MIRAHFTDAEVREALCEAVASTGSADEWGEIHHYSGRHVRGVLSGERPIPAGFYAALGFDRLTVTVRRRAHV